MRTFLAFALSWLFILPAHAQKTAQNPIARLLGAYLRFEEALDEAGNPRAGIMFADEGHFYGYNGCRSFSGTYQYSAETGFSWGTTQWEERKCLGLVKIFSPESLQSAKSFEIKENRVIFYDGNGSELVRLFAVAPFDENTVLPAGDWQLAESNYPSFAEMQQRNSTPCLRLTVDKHFALCYYPKKGVWAGEYCLSGRYNAGKARFLFCFDASKKAFGLPERTDKLLADELSRAGHWQMEGARLVFKSGGTRFVFEKLKR